MRRLIIALVTAASLSACGSGGSSPSVAGGSTPTAPGTGTSTPTPPPPAWTVPLMQNTYAPSVDPSKFTDNVTNPLLPFKPGTTAVYEGTRDGVPLRIEVTITKETKVIMGVRCVVVRDIVTGALEERTTDWYAQDSSGNVWYFGEDTKELKNGVVTSTQGSWTGGVDGALPGIIMLAHPAKGDAYRQEYRPTVAEDVAMVKQLGATATVPAGTYRNVVVTNDRDLLDLTKDEDKFYAPGVGIVKLQGFVNGHFEKVWLTSILTAK